MRVQSHVRWLLHVLCVHSGYISTSKLENCCAVQLLQYQTVHQNGDDGLLRVGDFLAHLLEAAEVAVPLLLEPRDDREVGPGAERRLGFPVGQPAQDAARHVALVLPLVPVPVAKRERKSRTFNASRPRT